jgi:hypothetical protein
MRTLTSDLDCFFFHVLLLYPLYSDMALDHDVYDSFAST